jgi:hypothetical protein
MNRQIWRRGGVPLATCGRVLAGAALLAVAAGCSMDQMKDGMAGSLRNWCRHASNCTAQQEEPR